MPASEIRDIRRQITKHSAQGANQEQGSGEPSGCHPAHMSQPNRVGRRISPRSLAGHERLPVRLSHVASAETLDEKPQKKKESE